MSEFSALLCIPAFWSLFDPTCPSAILFALVVMIADLEAYIADVLDKSGDIFPIGYFFRHSHGGILSFSGGRQRPRCAALVSAHSLELLHEHKSRVRVVSFSGGYRKN